MPIRPSDEDWSKEGRDDAADEAPSRDVDDDPDAQAGEEIDDPLEDDDDGA